MSIRTSFNPLGTLGNVQWYNWAAEKYASAKGRTVYSDTYIISDFITLPPGTYEFAAVGSYTEDGRVIGLIAYSANGSVLDWWTFASVVSTVTREISMPSITAYVRIQTTRDLYRECYIIQNGVYFFKGEDNPPKPITQS